MRRNKVDLNLFVVFDAIYTERNLTRAAESLHLTQPTLSHSLGRLREALNDDLFVRTPKGMTPTPLAENIIGRIRESLRLMDASILEGHLFDPATSDRVFRISMNEVAETQLLEDLVDELQKTAPTITLQSYYAPRRELALALSSGQLELAIDIFERADPELYRTKLYTERYICLVRPDHPHVGNDLSLEQYLRLEHIHVSDRRQGPGHVDIELSKLGHQRKIRIRSQHYNLASNIVRSTNFALTVPSRWAPNTDLKLLELPFDMPSHDVHILWHKSADGDQANRWLRERIIALLGE